jgi:hypothetical protein
MSSTINVNKRTVVHKSSDGVSTAFPDVCKTPTPGGPVPIPYPNIARSADTANGSTSVKMNGNPIMLKDSNFSTSTGDEAGSAGGGVASSKTRGKAEYINYSFDVKVEGKNVPRLGDMMVQNKGGSPNTPPFPEVQPPLVAMTVSVKSKDDCPACDPPVGTVAYEVHLCPPGKPHYPCTDDHVHFFLRQQSPKARGCKCFWKRNFRPVQCVPHGDIFVPGPSMVPI